MVRRHQGREHRRLHQHLLVLLVRFTYIGLLVTHRVLGISNTHTLSGNAVKKHPRWRYDEIERLYQCSWADCNKSYGTLNHLNPHVTMQNHGAKRSPNGLCSSSFFLSSNLPWIIEFKELRKQWHKAKKESEATNTIVRRDSYSDA
jgi:transcription factor CON7